MNDEPQVPPERIAVDTALVILANAELNETGWVDFEPRVYYVG